MEALNERLRVIKGELDKTLATIRELPCARSKDTKDLLLDSRYLAANASLARNTHSYVFPTEIIPSRLDPLQQCHGVAVHVQSNAAKHSRYIC